MRKMTGLPHQDLLSGYPPHQMAFLSESVVNLGLPDIKHDITLDDENKRRYSDVIDGDERGVEGLPKVKKTRQSRESFFDTDGSG